MNCKKVVIETDGTSKNTNIFVDGEKVGFIKNISFFASSDNDYISLTGTQFVKEENDWVEKLLDIKFVK